MEMINDYMNKLKTNFSETDGSIGSLKDTINTMLVTGYLDKNDVINHNAWFFSDSPEYIHNSFEDLELLEITLGIIENGNFSTFDELCSFIDFICNNKSFEEIHAGINSINLADKIISAEGSRCAKISGLSKDRVRMLVNGITLSDDALVQYYKNFPNNYSGFNGPTICKLMDFLGETNNKAYTILKEDISTAYPKFNLSIIDNYKENDLIEDFCITMKEFNKTFKNKTKEVK